MSDREGPTARKLAVLATASLLAAGGLALAQQTPAEKAAPPAKATPVSDQKPAPTVPPKAAAPKAAVPKAAPAPAAKATPAPAAKAAPAPAAKAAPAPAAKAAPAAATPAAEPAKPATPSPATTRSAAETTYFATMDGLIAPARDLPLDVAEAQRVREAAKATIESKIADAKAARDAIVDPVAQKLADWLLLRAGVGEIADFRNFLEQNPDWPDRGTIRSRMEEALFLRGGTAREIREGFAKEGPRSAAGYAALASAHMTLGEEDKAREYAAKAWREHDFTASLEAGFLERFGKLLTEADHKWRLERLILTDIRWQGERNDKAAIIRRTIAQLSAPEKQKAEARLAVYLRAPLAAKLYTALPPEALAEWGVAFHHIQLLRRENRFDEAFAIMLRAPVDPAVIVSPDDWWLERRLLAYAALRLGKPQVAYDLVKDAGPLSVNPSKDQTFLAGWIALRHLKDTAKAEPHFLAQKKAADGPLSAAKADYWLARFYEIKGDKAKARSHYEAAAQQFDTFYGLLAKNAIDPGPARPLPTKLPAAPTAAEIARFNALEPVKAAVIARKSGLDISIVRTILAQIRPLTKSEAEIALLAHLAEALGDTQMAVRIGKSAIARGQNLVLYAYPVHTFPGYTPLRAPPEPAFLLGIARQETEFNTQITSGAGARGLLQVMPVTARHVCRDYKVKCDMPRLLSDVVYNTMLGSAYIGDRMNEFAGSYVLTMAGYNAGPGRARQWIREFGDPRDPKVDPIDWIERIPFEETREYVKKVMANVQIYRSRLGEGPTALQISADLVRARGKTSLPAAAAEPAEPPAASDE